TACHGLHPSGDEPGERALAVAVGAEQADAVIRIEPEIQILQYRRSRHITDAGPFQPDQRTGKGLGRVRDQERGHAFLDLLRDRLHAGERLDAALRLRGLGGLRLEARDERLDVAALIVLLLLELEIEPLLLAPRLLEPIVAARVERELA